MRKRKKLSTQCAPEVSPSCRLNRSTWPCTSRAGFSRRSTRGTSHRAKRVRACPKTTIAQFCLCYPCYHNNSCSVDQMFTRTSIKKAHLNLQGGLRSLDLERAGRRRSSAHLIAPVLTAAVSAEYLINSWIELSRTSSFTHHYFPVYKLEDGAILNAYPAPQPPLHDGAGIGGAQPPPHTPEAKQADERSTRPRRRTERAREQCILTMLDRSLQPPGN